MVKKAMWVQLRQSPAVQLIRVARRDSRIPALVRNGAQVFFHELARESKSHIFAGEKAQFLRRSRRPTERRHR